MSTDLQIDLNPSIKREFGTLASEARVTRTVAALEANGIHVLRAADAAEAKLRSWTSSQMGRRSTTAPRNRWSSPASPRPSRPPADTTPSVLAS